MRCCFGGLSLSYLHAHFCSFANMLAYDFDRVNGTAYAGYTDLLGAEVRRDLSPKWDVGASASVLHTWGSHTANYGLGPSLGYRLMDNTWMALGYNVLGFRDRDFAGAEYRARGVYLSVRVKVDQDTLGLNRNRLLPAAP